MINSCDIMCEHLITTMQGASEGIRYAVHYCTKYHSCVGVENHVRCDDCAEEELFQNLNKTTTTYKGFNYESCC